MYKQIIFALLGVFLCIFLILRYLDYYTSHNQHIILPDFHGVHVHELDSMTDKYKLRYIIIDSVFNRDLNKGIVIGQDPLPNTNVKKNRRVYFTINALQRKIVSFPDILDLSLRQAIRRLEVLGLVIGDLEYRIDIAQNVILDHKIRGIQIKEGQEVFVGSSIDLVVGSGLSDKTTSIPDLLGLDQENALREIKISSLNIGAIIFDQSVLDTSSSIVYKQNPKANDKRKVSLGTSIDIYLK